MKNKPEADKCVVCGNMQFIEKDKKEISDKNYQDEDF